MSTSSRPSGAAQLPLLPGTRRVAVPRVARLYRCCVRLPLRVGIDAIAAVWAVGRRRYKKSHKMADGDHDLAAASAVLPEKARVGLFARLAPLARRARVRKI